MGLTSDQVREFFNMSTSANMATWTNNANAIDQPCHHRTIPIQTPRTEQNRTSKEEKRRVEKRRGPKSPTKIDQSRRVEKGRAAICCC
jgi:hypothetical protein